MKLCTRKVLAGTAVMAFVAVGAFAALDPAAEFKEAVDELVAPLVDARTGIQFDARQVKLDESQTLAFEGRLHFKKTGPENFLDLTVEPLRYDAESAQDPRARVKAALNVDLLKLLGQEQINAVGDVALDLVGGWLHSLIEDYGDAASTSVTITDKQVDADGNLQTLALAAELSVAIEKLPKEIDPAGVIFRAADVTVRIDRQGMVDFDALLVPHTGNPAFQPGHEGMKAVIEKVMARDADLFAQLREQLQSIDQVATSIVDHNDFGFRFR